MSNAVAGKILWSQIRRHARRIDLWIIRGLALLWYVWMLQPAAVNLGHREYMFKLVTFGCGLAFFLSGWLAGDLLETRNNQFLDLLRMTRLGPMQWHVINLALAYLKFFWVICVRWPVLFTLWLMGKLTLLDLAILEGSLSILFVLTLNVWMYVAFTSGISRRNLAVIAAFVPPLFDLLILISSSLVMFFAQFAPQMVAAIQIAGRSVSVISHLAQIAPFPGPGGLPAWPLMFYTAISVGYVVRLQRQFRDGWREEWPEFQRAPERKHDTPTRRISRRAWEDAFAWQAANVHGNGSKAIEFKISAYFLLLVIVGLCAAQGMREAATMLLSIGAAMGTVLSMQKTAECLNQELKHQTLPTLVMAESEELKIFPGWQRGAYWLALPDMVFVVIACLGISIWWPNAAITLLGSCWAIYASGPLFMVSALVPQSIKGFMTGTAIAVSIVLLTILTIVVSNGLERPVVFAGSILSVSVVYNAILKRWALPFWFRQRVEGLN